MKKLTLILLLIPILSFGQDFRKMSFGESIEDLTETYTDIEFEVVDGDLFGLDKKDIEVAYRTGIISGIETLICYVFHQKRFLNGMYLFDAESTKDGDERIKDYKVVSERLNEKYKMINEDTWHKSTWEDNPNYFGFALNMGDVDFREVYYSEEVTIVNSLSKEDGFLIHIVNYSSPEFLELVTKDDEYDF